MPDLFFTDTHPADLPPWLWVRDAWQPAANDMAWGFALSAALFIGWLMLAVFPLSNLTLG